MSREEVEGRLEQLLGGAMAKQLVKQKELEQKEKSEGKVKLVIKIQDRLQLMYLRMK